MSDKYRAEPDPLSQKNTMLTTDEIEKSVIYKEGLVSTDQKSPQATKSPENLQQAKSKILNSENLSKVLNLISNIKRLKLLYGNYGEDGEYTREFHQKCDKSKSTLVIVKHGLTIAGGYTDQSWEGTNLTKFSSEAFLFSLKTNKIYRIKNEKNAIYCDPECGPIFGREFSSRRIQQIARSSVRKFSRWQAEKSVKSKVSEVKRWSVKQTVSLSERNIKRL